MISGALTLLGNFVASQWGDASKMIEAYQNSKKMCAKSSDKDALKNLTAVKKRDFYYRMANATYNEDISSLSAQLLFHWLEGNGEEKIIDSDRIKIFISVKDYLLNESRAVFLSQKEAFINGKRAGIKGIKLRIDNPSAYNWDGISPLEMTYEGNPLEIVTVGEFMNIQQKVLNGQQLSDDEKIMSDLFTSLHTTGLVSKVKLKVNSQGNNKYKIEFLDWECMIKDNYNWDNKQTIMGRIVNCTKMLTILNPDYNNPQNASEPVSASKKVITIYHKNAKEIENATDTSGRNLAKSFDFKTHFWKVDDPQILTSFDFTNA